MIKKLLLISIVYIFLFSGVQGFDIVEKIKSYKNIEKIYDIEDLKNENVFKHQGKKNIYIVEKEKTNVDKDFFYLYIYIKENSTDGKKNLKTQFDFFKRKIDKNKKYIGLKIGDKIGFQEKRKDLKNECVYINEDAFKLIETYANLYGSMSLKHEKSGNKTNNLLDEYREYNKKDKFFFTSTNYNNYIFASCYRNKNKIIAVSSLIDTKHVAYLIDNQDRIIKEINKYKGLNKEEIYNKLKKEKVYDYERYKNQDFENIRTEEIEDYFFKNKGVCGGLALGYGLIANYLGVADFTMLVGKSSDMIHTNLYENGKYYDITRDTVLSKKDNNYKNKYYATDKPKSLDDDYIIIENKKVTKTLKKYGEIEDKYEELIYNKMDNFSEKKVKEIKEKVKKVINKFKDKEKIVEILNHILYY